MKQKTFLRLSLLLFIASCTGIFIRCSSDDSGNGGQTGTNDYQLTVFKNQTGNPDANALQAQYKDDNGVLNVYGRFDSSNNPADVHTLTYQKTNNDTIVNMVIDPVFKRIKSTFLTVNGAKQPIVMKFDYANESFVNVSFYDYDWAAGSAELVYSSNVAGSDGNYTSNPVYGSRSVSGTNSWEALGVIGSSILISEGIILALGGETIVLAALGTAAAPIIATVGTVGVAVGIAAVALAVITSDANASELDPTDMPYPQDTPAENPATEENDPTENLPVTECIENALTYEVFMDGEGTIVIESPTAGGSGPYSYFLEGQPGFTDIGIYPGDYDNGEYVVAVKDGNGCITAKIVTLNRDCADTDLAVSATSQGNSATATATGGQPPYTYQWTNGTTGASISELEPGTYTVTVTDGNGCSTTEEIVIEEIVFNYAGTWVRRMYENGNLYQDNEIIFDSEGNSISAQSNIYPSETGWVEDIDNWKLQYDDGFITITNLHWGTSLSFEVNDPDASQFYLPGQENFSNEGDWWTLVRQ